MNEGLLNLDHATLLALRKQAKDRELQNLLAGYEHRAFAREAVQENPLMALSIGAAIPLYQAYKLTPWSKSRSDPSFDQMTQGLLGIKEGLFKR